MTTVSVYAIIVEERNDYPPYGDGKVINRQIASVHRHPAKAQAELAAERGRWQTSRFRVFMQTERVEERLAREVPA